VASLRGGGKRGQLPPSLPTTVPEIRPDPLRFIFEGGYPPHLDLPAVEVFHADPSSAGDKMQRLVTCVEELNRWMCTNRLKLNMDKTQFIWLGTPHQLSKVSCWKIQLGDVEIEISNEAMCLGVLLDSKLTFGPHIRRLSGKCFCHLRQIKRVRRFLTVQASKTMIHAFVTSRVDYCNSVVHGASTVHIRPLQNVLNAAARLVMNKRKFENITAEIRDQLHWLPVQQRTEYKTYVIVYKCLHEMA